MASDQRCGTCRHFAPEKEVPEFGDCLWAGAVPIWVIDAERQDGMLAHDGRTCRTWESADAR